MLAPPFELIECSWPRPVEQVGDQWVSEPDWDLPIMPFRPQPWWEILRRADLPEPGNEEMVWMIDWRAFFHANLKAAVGHLAGEMRGFYLVFRVRIFRDGMLAIWDDDGSIVRRNGEVLYVDRSAHSLRRAEIPVCSGDVLEIAQWQARGGWLWGAGVSLPGALEDVAADILRPYGAAVEANLARPNGPPMKLLCHGSNPWRTVVCIYSMILNGYRPEQLYLYGDYQWSPAARRIYETWLPFARVISLGQVLDQVRAAGQPLLVDFARRHFFVMKTCVSLLCAPTEFCLMDDDVFILDRVDSALDAFFGRNRQSSVPCDLVFMTDADYTDRYLRFWGDTLHLARPLATARFNAGLYWLRNNKNPLQVAGEAVRVSPDGADPMNWEQGFIAGIFARDHVYPLHSGRYFYPVFDGLPGGTFGYDYATNPCRFASLHFGGLWEKPPDAGALLLAAQVLGRGTAVG